MDQEAVDSGPGAVGAASPLAFDTPEERRCARMACRLAARTALVGFVVSGGLLLVLLPGGLPGVAAFVLSFCTVGTFRAYLFHRGDAAALSGPDRRA